MNLLWALGLLVAVTRAAWVRSLLFFFYTSILRYNCGHWNISWLVWWIWCSCSKRVHKSFYCLNLRTDFFSRCSVVCSLFLVPESLNYYSPNIILKMISYFRWARSTGPRSATTVFWGTDGRRPTSSRFPTETAATSVTDGSDSGAEFHFFSIPLYHRVLVHHYSSPCEMPIFRLFSVLSALLLWSTLSLDQNTFFIRANSNCSGECGALWSRTPINNPIQNF